MKNKKLVTVIILIVVSIFGLLLFYAFKNTSDSSTQKTNEEIREMFSCNRVTADFRETDVYCGDPELYRQHLRDNRVIEPY